MSFRPGAAAGSDRAGTVQRSADKALIAAIRIMFTLFSHALVGGRVPPGYATGGSRPTLVFSEFEVDLGTDGPRLVDGVANQLRDVELELSVVRGHQRRLVGQVVDEQMRGPCPVRERDARIRDGVGRQVHAE